MLGMQLTAWVTVGHAGVLQQKSNDEMRKLSVQ